MTSTPYRCVLLAACLVALACGSSPEAQAASAVPETEDQKILYALGLVVAQQVATLNLTADELEMVQSGFADAVRGGEPQVALQEYGPKIQGFAEGRIKVAAAAEVGEAEAFLAAEAAKDGAVRSESGVIMFEMTPGTGESPSAQSRVRVHYHGTLRDGSIFDSSVDRGQPAEFGLNQVIGCWTESVQKMKVGGKSRLVCPAETAYGAEGRPGIPGGAALVFEVELLEILSE